MLFQLCRLNVKKIGGRYFWRERKCILKWCTSPFNRNLEQNFPHRRPGGANSIGSSRKNNSLKAIVVANSKVIVRITTQVIAWSFVSLQVLHQRGWVGLAFPLGDRLAAGLQQNAPQVFGISYCCSSHWVTYDFCQICRISKGNVPKRS